MTSVRTMLILAAMLIASVPSFAQTTPPPSAGTMPGGQPGMTHPGMMMMGEGGAMMRGRMMAMMAGHVDGWLAFLKTELKITDAQSAPWNGFADAVRANAQGMKDMHAAAMAQPRPTALPDRLALHEKALSAHLDAVRRLRAAVEPLYAAFSDEQKKTADELIGGMGMM
jgi:hypothetical protein